MGGTQTIQLWYAADLVPDAARSRGTRRLPSDEGQAENSGALDETNLG